MSVETKLSQARSMTATWPVPVEPVVPTLLTSPGDTPEQKVETPWDENVRQLEDLLSQDWYKEAVLFGDTVRREHGTAPDTDSAYSTTARAEFDVHHAQALIYTGETEEAITVLRRAITEMECGRDPQDVAWQSGPHPFENRRRNWVLGQAHNHLGYTYWMNHGHCRLALRELYAALPYFAASELREEYANTCDNLGRVYAQLRLHSLAQDWIDKGLEMRRELKGEYRKALSLNSQAIAHQMSGELYKAHQPSVEALSICEQLGVQRGIGLACITRGRSLRQLGGFDTVYSHEKCITLLEQAATYLGRAIEIFEQHVYEPVRLIEAYNELGCTYRDWADLVRHRDPDSQVVGHCHDTAVQYLRTAIKLAEKENTLLCVDSCQDLARTYFQNRQFDAAERWLRYVEDIIPDMYKIGESSWLRDVPIEECVEGFWCQMGKMELLRGHLALERGMSNNSGRVSREVLRQAAQHRASAIAYFDHHGEQAVETSTIFQQIHSRFKHCQTDDIQYVRDEILPTNAETHTLDPSDSCGLLAGAKNKVKSISKGSLGAQFAEHNRRIGTPVLNAQSQGSREAQRPMNVTLKLQPRRSPEPGRPFINRGRELKLVGDKLDIGMQGKPMQSAVTCFWGAFGMGKSWLLLELERRYKHAGLKGVGSHPTIAARLDVNREVLALWQNDRLNREQLIRELWKQLASQLGTDVPDLGRASADEWAHAFVREVTEWSTQSAIPLIMLDTMDDLVRLDEPTFFWLEQHLVERLALTDRVLFVFTSRGELRRWRRFQVRRRVDSHRLTAFDAETAGQEVKASSAVSEALYGHAFGHPLVTEYLGTALENLGVSLQEAGKVERLIEPSLVQAILREVIGEILKAVPEPLAKLAKPASVLRWVSVESLRFLAERLGLVEPGRGDAYYLDELIAGLQAHHLLYWNSGKSSYAPDPVLRRLLPHFLELDEPTRFCEAHLAAFDFHRGHLNEYPNYLARYVPELAYHRTMLAHCESREPQPLTLQMWWEKFLSEKAPTNPEPWTDLVGVLKRDKELEEVLPVLDYKSLHAEAQKRAAGAAVNPRGQ